MEKGIAHFEVSNAGFGDLLAQVENAIIFLHSNVIDLQKMMSHPNASGVLDFAVEWRDVAVQYDPFQRNWFVRLAVSGCHLIFPTIPAWSMRLGR